MLGREASRRVATPTLSMLIPFLLSFLAAAQGGPAHAELHPIESDLYLEIGDASRLLAELDKAPLVRFLRDERIARLMADLGRPTDRPLKELAQDGLAGVLPGADRWLDGLRACSVSVVALGPATKDAAPATFLAILDFATPEHAGALRTALVERAPEHEPVQSIVPGVEALRQIDAPAEDRWCVVVGSRLVMGGKPSKVEDYAARAEKKLPGLARSETFQKQLAALGGASGTPVLWFALARPLREMVAKMQPGEDAGMAFLSLLPEDLDPFGSTRVARMQFVGERFVTDMVSSDAGGAAQPVEPTWLAHVPAGSMLVYASAFDGAAAGKRLRTLLAKDEASTAALAALEEGLGFGPERMLARLGPAMTAYSAPLTGFALPEVRLWIDCDDPAAFTSEFEAVFNALAASGFQVKTRNYSVKKEGEKIEVPYTTLALPPSWQVIPMINPTPTFAAVGKKLVFTLSSMEIKSELKRIHGAAGEPVVPGADPLAALGFQLPPGARSVLVMDWGRLFGSVIGTAKAMGPLLGEELPFDLNKLPAPELFTQYFKPTFHYSEACAAGLHRRNEASFGPETWFPILMQGAAMASSSLEEARAAKQRAEEAAAAERQAPPRETPGGGQ
jgi:hypothetical protein